MANTIHVDIVSAEGQIFSGDASMVFVPGSQGELGIAPLDVKVILHEVPRENWGLRGGIPGSEIQLGFKVEV